MNKMDFDGNDKYIETLCKFADTDDLKPVLTKGTTYLFFSGHIDNPFTSNLQPISMITFHGGFLQPLIPGIPIDYPFLGWAVSDFVDNKVGGRLKTIRS